MKLYDFLPSGNGYKIRLLLSQLQVPFELIEVDILRGASRTDEFLAKNANGRIPLVQLDDGRLLAESNAILFYFAEGTPFLSANRFERAETLQWMFFEQYSHEPNIATSRFWRMHPELMNDEKRAQLPQKQALGYAALAVMEGHLAQHSYFVANRYGIADIALYAYTHVAEEGGFDLAAYPAVRAWIERIRAQPGYVTITQSSFPAPPA